MKRAEREDRPLNTSDGRKVRELEPRFMKEREKKMFKKTLRREKGK